MGPRQTEITDKWIYHQYFGRILFPPKLIEEFIWFYCL